MFRFTIRDLLWLMLVAALAAAWWVDRSQLAARPWGYVVHPARLR